MRSIILAAGRGSRLGDLTAGRPKCLVELFGKPLVQWQIESLRRAGAERIGIVRGYRADLLDGYGTDKFDNPLWGTTNMVMSLVEARSWLRETGCVVSYSDIVYPAAAVRLLETTGPIALTYDVNWLSLWSRRFVDPLADAETFRVDASGNVVDIGRRASSVEEIAGQYMGLLRISPEGWQWIEALLDEVEPETRFRLDMTSLLSRLIAAGRPVEGVPFDGTWGEVDCPEDLAVYQAVPDLPARLSA